MKKVRAPTKPYFEKGEISIVFYETFVAYDEKDLDHLKVCQHRIESAVTPQQLTI